MDAPVAVGEPIEYWIGMVSRPSPLPPYFAFVLAGEKAAGERAPGAQADAEFLSGGNVLALDIAFGERIFELHVAQRSSPPSPRGFGAGEYQAGVSERP